MYTPWVFQMWIDSNELLISQHKPFTDGLQKWFVHIPLGNGKLCNAECYTGISQPITIA